MENQKHQIKINIGCGPTGKIHGFDNLDNSPSVLISKFKLLKFILYKLNLIAEHQYLADWSGVVWCDASKRLPYHDNTVFKIYSSHFLEHIPEDDAIRVLKECYRVLRNDGTMRLIVPDLLFHANNYVEKTKAMLMQSELPSERDEHDKFLKTIYGAYLSKKRYGAEHAYMYDLPTLTCILRKIGFRYIKKCGFNEGSDMELASYDSRPEDSLHLEIRK